MKKLVTLALSFALVGILSACGGGNNAQEPAPAPEQPAAEQPAEQPAEEPAAEEPAAEEPAAEGTVDAVAAEEKYQASSCVACHGADLSGASGPNLQKVGSKYSKDQIAGIIKNGQGTMPGGMLQGEDADLVAAWLAEKK